MIEMIQTIDECWEFVSGFYGEPQFSDPMLTNEEQFQRNLANCIEKPEKHLALGVYLDGQMIGLFSFLLIREERYMEMLVGLSRVQSAYEEMFRYLERYYLGYDVDFVFNPENYILKQMLKVRAAEFEPEQQKMVFVGPALKVDTSGVELYSATYEEGYMAIHNKDTYWRAEKVVTALDRFRVLVAIHEGNVVGYLDVTRCFDENEPFICCYIGLVFLLICAAMLALKQLTETTDNIYRYGLLQKLGAKRQQINHSLLIQLAVFFFIPLLVAGLYSILLIAKGMEIVEEFMNIHIATNVGLTAILFLIVYGSYFIATYISCKRMITEQKDMEV